MMSKTIVVIGASTGIGKAIVQEAAKNPENEISKNCVMSPLHF